MTEPSLHHVECPDAQGRHRMAWWQWGDPRSSHVVLCVHGLTRQGRDFDALAKVLLAKAGGALRIVCPDVVGRGESDWLADPQGYQIPQYASDMLALLVRLQADAPVTVLDYVGTSMGGLIGIVLAGQSGMPLPVPIHRLVINDVGPTLDAAAIGRIGSYVGKGEVYPSVEAGAEAQWALSTGFGPHSQEEWLALSRPMLVPANWRSADGSRKVPASAGSSANDGPFRLHYDPAIGVPFRAMTPEAAEQAEAATWGLYDAITAETLLVRGAESDLLSAATAHAMTERGPKARLHEISGVGHAPTFVDPVQSDVVARFLLEV